MTAPNHLHPELSGALRTFGFWIANGTLGQPVLDGIDYRSVMMSEPSLMEQTLAIFVNVLVVDGDGRPLNAGEAERRAAMWVRQYCTGQKSEPPLEPWEVELH